MTAAPSTKPASWCAEQRSVTIAGPEGPLEGTLLVADARRPFVLIVPGSGPTDRDGDNPLGSKAASYRLLAEELANQGINTLRIDKRGLFGSASAISDPNDVRIDDYADDVLAWINFLRAQCSAGQIILAGHSEGGLVAMIAAPRVELAGMILLTTPMKRLGDVLRDQFRQHLDGAERDQATEAVSALERGAKVDVTGMDAALAPVFAPAVQDFLASVMQVDPGELLATTALPTLIVLGGRDEQIEAVGRADVKASPSCRFESIPEMNHVLKDVDGSDLQRVRGYNDPNVPISTGLVGAVTDFIDHGLRRRTSGSHDLHQATGGERGQVPAHDGGRPAPR